MDETKKIPDLGARQTYFLLTQKLGNKAEIEKNLLNIIERDSMAPYYLFASRDGPYKVLQFDNSYYEALNMRNKTELEIIDKEIEEAQEKEGESEITSGLIKRAEYLAKIGSNDEAVLAFRKAYEREITVGVKFDILFTIIRIGFLHWNQDLIRRNIENLFEEGGGDWDRRNRLKVYEALYLLTVRQYQQATQLFLDTLSTFSCNELMEYSEFISLACICSLITLSRVELKDKILSSPEILEVLPQYPAVQGLCNSLYECRYHEFFPMLSDVEEQFLMKSTYLYQHRKYYVREMRVIGYTQLLESYRSVTLESIARSFNISIEFVDKFISNGKLCAVIDKVNGIVMTNRKDSKLAQYTLTLKHGDLLLNRIQKLSRVINL